VPQAVGHDAAVMLQRTLVSGLPALDTVAWNPCTAPSSTAELPGESVTTRSLVMVSVAFAYLEESALLAAMICTAAPGGRSAGAL
jgi:hypothetical protein